LIQWVEEISEPNAEKSVAVHSAIHVRIHQNCAQRKRKNPKALPVFAALNRATGNPANADKVTGAVSFDLV